MQAKEKLTARLAMVEHSISGGEGGPWLLILKTVIQKQSLVYSNRAVIIDAHMYSKLD